MVKKVKMRMDFMNRRIFVVKISPNRNYITINPEWNFLWQCAHKGTHFSNSSCSWIPFFLNAAKRDVCFPNTVSILLIGYRNSPEDLIEQYYLFIIALKKNIFILVTTCLLPPETFKPKILNIETEHLKSISYIPTHKLYT